LGITHQVAPWLGLSKSPKESFSRAIEMAKKAVALDETFASAHGFLGYMYAMTRQHDKALIEGERAYELAPTSADVLFAYGATLFFSGQFEKANQMLREAIRLNPVSPNIHLIFLAVTLREMGQYDEAIAISQTVLSRDPKNDLAHLTIIASYIYDDQIEVAHEKANEFLKIYPNFSLSRYEKILPYKNQAVKKHYIDALRKEGLPQHPPFPLPDKPSIAVLPFVNMSGDPEQEYLSDGISEEIITALSKTPKLLVIARTSSFKYKGKEADLRMVGRELGVKYVLEGSVRRSGDKVRITAQLIDAQTNNHLWAERYDRDLNDIFAIQDAITLKVLKALDVKLIRGEEAKMLGKGVDNLEVYIKALKARNYLYQWNREGIIESRKLTEEVIRMAPQYASAYQGLAGVTMMEVFLGMSQSPRESLLTAIELCKKAISLDDSLPGAHGLLGLLYVQIRQYDKGIAECEKAIELAPSSADVYSFMAQGLNFSGRPEEAIAYNEQAFRLNPTGAPTYYYSGASLSYFLTGRYDDTIKVCNEALKRWPKNTLAYARLAIAYMALGREEEARNAAQELLRIDPKFSAKKFAQMQPAKDPTTATRALELMNKAGLK
jgi:TolB-like protein/Tfp pilus assembly protein PilF